MNKPDILFEHGWREKLDWKSARKYKDKGYYHHTVQVLKGGDNLVVKMTPFRKCGMKPLFIIIFNFERYAANEVINVLHNQGRHFEDAILDYYTEHGLPIYPNNLKPVKFKKNANV